MQPRLAHGCGGGGSGMVGGPHGGCNQSTSQVSEGRNGKGNMVQNKKEPRQTTVGERWTVVRGNDVRQTGKASHTQNTQQMNIHEWWVTYFPFDT